MLVTITKFLVNDCFLRPKKLNNGFPDRKSELVFTEQEQHFIMYLSKSFLTEDWQALFGKIEDTINCFRDLPSLRMENL